MLTLLYPILFAEVNLCFKDNINTYMPGDINFDLLDPGVDANTRQGRVLLPRYDDHAKRPIASVAAVLAGDVATGRVTLVIVEVPVERECMRVTKNLTHSHLCYHKATHGRKNMSWLYYNENRSEKHTEK